MRWVLRILKWLGLGLGGLFLAGAVYQQIGLAFDVAPPASDMITVDGRTVHLVCTGPNGKAKRTFVLDAGAGAGVFEWLHLQPLLSKDARVCAFDRAGLGWSDSAPGYAADADSDRLAALVKAAHIPTPFVYVGHSLGADFAIVYRQRHPKDVSALVLIEPGMPADLLEDFHGTRDEAMLEDGCGLSCYAGGAVTLFGVTRLAGFAAGHKTFDETHRAIYLAHTTQPATVMTTLASLHALPRTATQVREAEDFPGTPVLTLASSAPRDPEGTETVDDVKRWKVKQRAWLASLAAKSPHGQGPIDVPNSTHASMVLGAPQSAFVARTILDFLTAAGR